MKKVIVALALSFMMIATALPAFAADNVYTGTVNRAYISNTTLWVKITHDSGTTSLMRVNANLESSKMIYATLLTAISLDKQVIMAETGGVWENKVYILP